MSNAAYSEMKVAWHTDRCDALRSGASVVPVGVQLILSDLCNHDCHFCAYRASDGLSTERFAEHTDKGVVRNPNRMISLGKSLEIVEDCHKTGVQSITFTGGGEPTVHPNHLEIMLRALNLGLACSLNTNGVVFREGWRSVFPRFAYVRFSVDAGNAKEYAAIRGCPESHYVKMLANLTCLVHEVDRVGSECVIGTGYVVTPDNYVNLVEGVRKLRDTGAKYVRLAAMQSTQGKKAYKGQWRKARDSARKCQELATDDFAVIDLMDGVIGDRPDYEFCGMQHLVLYIGANLECYRCCYTAYSEQGLVGNLNHMTLAEYIKDRDLTGFDARSCDVCPLNGKNRAINYMADPEPLHVSFI